MKFTDIDGWIGGDLPLDARLPLQSRLYLKIMIKRNRRRNTDLIDFNETCPSVAQ